jgi:hypothetical protein
LFLVNLQPARALRQVASESDGRRDGGTTHVKYFRPRLSLITPDVL